MDTIEMEKYLDEEYLETLDFSKHSIVCLCIHGGESKREFELFTAKCREVGAIPIGVADSTYYNSKKIVPEIEGLIRCLSDDLRNVIEYPLQYLIATNKKSGAKNL